jgi:hypothetical protein
VQVVVVGDLPHVVVEPPTLRVLLVGDAGELALHDGSLVVARPASMGAEDGHWDVARVAVENHEAKWVVMLGIPLRRVGQLTQLATFHWDDAALSAAFELAFGERR